MQCMDRQAQPHHQAATLVEIVPWLKSRSKWTVTALKSLWHSGLGTWLLWCLCGVWLFTHQRTIWCKWMGGCLSWLVTYTPQPSEWNRERKTLGFKWQVRVVLLWVQPLTVQKTTHATVEQWLSLTKASLFFCLNRRTFSRFFFFSLKVRKIISWFVSILVPICISQYTLFKGLPLSATNGAASLQDLPCEVYYNQPWASIKKQFCVTHK